MRVVPGDLGSEPPKGLSSRGGQRSWAVLTPRSTNSSGSSSSNRCIAAAAAAAATGRATGDIHLGAGGAPPERSSSEQQAQHRKQQQQLLLQEQQREEEELRRDGGGVSVQQQCDIRGAAGGGGGDSGSSSSGSSSSSEEVADWQCLRLTFGREGLLVRGASKGREVHAELLLPVAFFEGFEYQKQQQQQQQQQQEESESVLVPLKSFVNALLLFGDTQQMAAAAAAAQAHMRLRYVFGEGVLLLLLQQQQQQQQQQQVFSEIAIKTYSAGEGGSGCLSIGKALEKSAGQQRDYISVNVNRCCLFCCCCFCCKSCPCWCPSAGAAAAAAWVAGAGTAVFAQPQLFREVLQELLLCDEDAAAKVVIEWHPLPTAAAAAEAAAAEAAAAGTQDTAIFAAPADGLVGGDTKQQQLPLMTLVRLSLTLSAAAATVAAATKSSSSSSGSFFVEVCAQTVQSLVAHRVSFCPSFTAFSGYKVTAYHRHEFYLSALQALGAPLKTAQGLRLEFSNEGFLLAQLRYKAEETPLFLRYVLLPCAVSEGAEAPAPAD
ncbi:hypothetical protein Emed_005931 [Eimeria media]